MKNISYRAVGLIVLFVLLVWLLMGMPAFAGTAVVTWTNPTTRVDGSALLSSEIGGTKVEWGTCAGSAFGTVLGNQSTSGAATTLTVTGLAVGTYCFRAFTTTTTGATSVASNVASKIVPESPPSPPTIATVTTTAYVIKGNPKHRWFAAVGTVPLGTACGNVYPRNDLYAEIPREVVTITGNYRGQTLYGICG